MSFETCSLTRGCDYSHVNTLVLKVMLQQLEWGESIILDSDCMNPLKRAFIEALVKPFGVKEVKYLHVAGDREIWKARVKASDYRTLKMYANGVRRANGLRADDQVPVEEVQACVEAEWLRQREGHIDYAQTLKAIFVPNNGTKEQLSNDVAGIVALNFNK